MFRAGRHTLALSVLLACPCSPRAQEALPDAPNVFDFGELTLSAPLEHTFHFANEGAETLELANVQLTPPLIAVRGTASIAPGEEGSITVRLSQPREKGPFRGEIVVAFKQPAAQNRVFGVTGTLVPSIALDPPFGFYLAAQRGEHAERSLEIVNHEQEPLVIERAEYGGSTFAVALETLEPGRKYRVTMRLNPAAPAGKTTETVRLMTSSSVVPTIPVPANIWIKERVYAFPETLDLGTIGRTGADGRLSAVPTQTLMVYQVGATDLRVAVQTDLPFLVITPERSPLGDRYQLSVSVLPDQLADVGEIRGSITVTTNDPEFPQLTIPVTAVATAHRR